MPAAGLAEILEEVSRCSNCGLCQTACPIFRVTGKELGVARGRNQVLKALAEGTIEWKRDLHQVFFQCLGCRACTTNCFPAIQTHKIMAQARELYNKKFGASEPLRILFHEVLPYPSRMNALVRAAATGQRIHFDKLIPALKIFGWSSRSFGFSRSFDNLGRSKDLVPHLPNKPLRSEIKDRSKTGKVAYFVGCGINYMWPKVGHATISLIEKSCEDFFVLDNLCCGLPAYTYGYMDAARQLARRNIDLIIESGAEEIITECASCASFLKDYPGLFEHEHEYRDRAEEVSSRIRDLSEWLPIEGWPGSIEKKTVTFHEPCHLGRFQGLADKPRDILRAIPGIEYIEMNEADWCCGGAGSYNVSQYQLSMKVLDRKMNNIRETSADVVVTECPACMVQLAYGMKRHKLNQIQLLHLSELLVNLTNGVRH
jgi:glycolate oxidase iron-sulfur subunit